MSSQSFKKSSWVLSAHWIFPSPVISGPVRGIWLSIIDFFFLSTARESMLETQWSICSGYTVAAIGHQKLKCKCKSAQLFFSPPRHKDERFYEKKGAPPEPHIAVECQDSCSMSKRQTWQGCGSAAVSPGWETSIKFMGYTLKDHPTSWLVSLVGKSPKWGYPICVYIYTYTYTYTDGYHHGC
jgi:hypothetical protein